VSRIVRLPPPFCVGSPDELGAGTGNDPVGFATILVSVPSLMMLIFPGISVCAARAADAETMTDAQSAIAAASLTIWVMGPSAR
jgi:hypothetical protein